MDFVFMSTRNDATVASALALVEIARPLGHRHIGFKDVGADASKLQDLAAAIRSWSRPGGVKTAALYTTTKSRN
jgi:hypothetical protein